LKPGVKRKGVGKPRPDRKGDDRRPARGPRQSRSKKVSEDVISGRNPVVEALRAKIPAKELLIAERAEIDERITESIRLAKHQNLPIKEVPKAKIDGITASGVHQGIVLVIKPFQYKEFAQILNKANKPGLIIGMDGVTDPHNLGAIVRSAAAFGADGVVIPERRNASMTGSAWKSSAGAAARMPIAQVTNLVRSIEDAKKAGFFVVGLDADGDQSLPKFNLADESVYIIVGSEGKGLSRLVREKCDTILSIPMQSTVESLNASVASALVLYWISEKRN
jgi:23S rRNA (guanosine2251-2'-O)-methyltransferase